MLLIPFFLVTNEDEFGGNGKINLFLEIRIYFDFVFWNNRSPINTWQLFRTYIIKPYFVILNSKYP